MDLDTGLVYGIGGASAPTVVLIYRILRHDGLDRQPAIKDAVFLAAQNVKVNDDLATLNLRDGVHLPMDRLD